MTFVAVSDNETGTSGKGKTEGEGSGGPEARASRPRAREGTIITRTRAVTDRARDRVSGKLDDAGQGRSLWTEGAATPAEVVAYTRAGDWVPGEQAPWLERAGKAYGYLVALPVTCVLLVVAWIVQRPSRAAIAAVVAVLLVLAEVAA